MTACKLDRTKSYGEIIGATNGAKFYQNGKEFDFEGNPLVNEPVVSDEIPENKPKRGRPAKA